MSHTVFMKKIFLIFLSLGIGLYVTLALYTAQFTFPTPPIKADAAIVLGAKSYHGKEYNPCLVSRVNAGVTLYTGGYVSKLIFSGGKDREDNANEAKTMEEIAQNSSILQGDILLEQQSTSTYENLVNSARVIKENDLTNATIVTEPFHIARALLVAKSLGIETNYYPVFDSPCWVKGKYFSSYFLKEPLVIAYYIVTGKIKPGAFTK